VKDLYTKNYKTLMKETEKKTQMGRYPVFIEELILLKCPLYPKQFHF
jgi:hypothetical protein